MLLIQIAMFIFILTIAFVLTEKILWLFFLLFNFRIWHLFFTKTSFEFYNNLGTFGEILLISFISLAMYGGLYAITMRMPILRVIILALFMLVVFANYTLGEIFLFKDYFADSNIFTFDFWKKQLQQLFSLSGDGIVNIIEKVFNFLINFFKKIYDLVFSL